MYILAQPQNQEVPACSCVLVNRCLRYPMYKWAIFYAWEGTKYYIFSER